MRLLLDECVPRRLRRELPGHDVQTVQGAGWAGVKNDRAELVAELLRRTAFAPHDLPQDRDLVASADRLLVGLDRQERS